MNDIVCRCVREVYGIAKTNWDAFCGPDIVDLYGHLMIYPMMVNQDGRYNLTAAHLPDCIHLLSIHFPRKEELSLLNKEFILSSTFQSFGICSGPP